MAQTQLQLQTNVPSHHNRFWCFQVKYNPKPIDQLVNVADGNLLFLTTQKPHCLHDPVDINTVM